MATLTNSNATGTRVMHPSRWMQRTGALYAGVAMALMIPLAVFGNFIVFESLVTEGNAVATAVAVAESKGLWIAGIAALLAVAVLDVVAAAGMFALFRTTNPLISSVAGIIRTAYAGLFVLAISQLIVALDSTDNAQKTLDSVELFSSIWHYSLGLFGVCLLVLGYLAIQSVFMHKTFGILIGIAGMGYVADFVGLCFVTNFTPMFGNFGFIGETAMILWLLIRGRRLPRN